MLIEKVTIHLEKQLLYLQKMNEKRNFITKYETNNNENKPLITAGYFFFGRRNFILNGNLERSK